MKLIVFFILFSFDASAQGILFFAHNKPPAGHATTTIIFNQALDGGNNGGASNTHSYSFTASATSDRFLLVVILGDLVSGADDISSVTYNGDALTHIMTTSTGGSGRFKYLYYMLNPDVGVANIVITAGSTHFILSGAAEYQGVQGLDNQGSSVSGGAVTSLLSSITPVANNSWMIIAEDGYNSNNVPGAGTGATIRAADATFGTWGIFDGGAAISPAASTNMTTTRTTAASIAHAIITIKPW